MSKMHFLITNLEKSPSAGALQPQLLLTFDVSDVKLHDLAKLYIFKLIMAKSSYKRISYDVISVTSS